MSVKVECVVSLAKLQIALHNPPFCPYGSPAGTSHCLLKKKKKKHWEVNVEFT